MRKLVAALLLLVLFLSRTTSWAWSAQGHMTIAVLAYRQLPADEQKRVSEILRHHPDYGRWASDLLTNASVDLETLVVMRASAWPDEIRRHGNGYDHPNWHFVDYPLVPPSFDFKPSPAPTNDILYGIAQSEEMLDATNASAEERAVYLSWLLHLIGDLHQPLHCSTYVTEDYPAPSGDKGGNRFFIRPADRGVNLHSLWDQALGSRSNPRTAYTEALRLSRQYPRKELPELSEHTTIEAWSRESRALAITDAYLKGRLPGSRESAGAPSLPEGYTKTMKADAEKQAVLAGFRLADEIKKCVK